jgi:hypothetical protein
VSTPQASRTLLGRRRSMRVTCENYKQHKSAYVSTRQHTSSYAAVIMCQQGYAPHFRSTSSIRLRSCLSTSFANGSAVTVPLVIHTPLSISLVALNLFGFSSDRTAGGSHVTVPLVLHTSLSLVALNQFGFNMRMSCHHLRCVT